MACEDRFRSPVGRIEFRDPMQNKQWFTPAELARTCHSNEQEIVELARRHHWPRIHGEHGPRIGVELGAVKEALAAAPEDVHGSIMPHADQGPDRQTSDRP